MSYVSEQLEKLKAKNAIAVHTTIKDILFTIFLFILLAVGLLKLFFMQ